MSLRTAALVLWRRSNLRSLRGIASGEEQKRHRNDSVSFGSEGTYIFTNPNYASFNVRIRLHRIIIQRWLYDNPCKQKPSATPQNLEGLIICRLPQKSLLDVQQFLGFLINLFHC